jgi:hypothetical protein
MKHLATLQQSIETLRESVEAFQGREKKGWGFVHGTLRVSPKSLLCRRPVVERPIDIGGLEAFEHQVHCTHP